MNKLAIHIIVATSKNRVIGRNGAIPWHLPEDLQRFKKMTLHFPIVMGRKTFESIGRVLPFRQNIILTSQTNYSVDEATIISSFADIRSATVNDKIFIIGGGEVYKETMKSASYIHLTEIQEEFEGDTFFPEILKTDWIEISREKHDNGKLKYHYVTYSKKYKK